MEFGAPQTRSGAPKKMLIYSHNHKKLNKNIIFVVITIKTIIAS